MAKKVTIERLAEMTAKGFEEVRAEIRKEVRGLRKDMVEEFDRMNADMRELKLILGPLARTVGAHEREIQTLHVRVSRIEKKVGLAK